MIDQIKPATDCIYKFFCMVGLIVLTVGLYGLVNADLQEDAAYDRIHEMLVQSSLDGTPPDSTVIEAKLDWADIRGNRFRKSSIFTILVGVATMWYFGKLWFEKKQLHEDEILASKALTASAELRRSIVDQVVAEMGLQVGSIAAAIASSFEDNEITSTVTAHDAQIATDITAAGSETGPA